MDGRMIFSSMGPLVYISKYGSAQNKCVVHSNLVIEVTKDTVING